jgi:NAD(P)-dependent dehydrogenase (short-subunit alcohol dehydrogenase family)
VARNPFDIEDKLVVVTGGLGQLGRQFSLALVERGAKVAVFDLGAGQAQTIKALPRGLNENNWVALTVDVSKRESLEAALAQLNDRWGIPDALINAAALDSPPDAPAGENGPFEGYPEESWNRVIDVNLKGVFLCCQTVGGQMASAGRGSIVNIGSTYGMVSPDQRIYQHRRSEAAPFFKPVAYSASKSGLVNLTRYLATYWAERKVRVNMLTLGGVFNHQDAQFVTQYCARVPMGRMARADEYNGAVIFLISEASSYMTGSNLVIDGGWTAW